MATTNDADLQYGPTPEDAQHEHTDIEPAIAWKFALWLGVAMVISAAIVYGTFWFFEGREQAVQSATQIYPLAAGQTKEPPGPRLQTQPFKDVYLLRQAEQERLTGYGWVDKGAGVVHIPVDDAMRLLTERGMLAARPGAQTTDQQVVMDSSAGRTTAAR